MAVKKQLSKWTLRGENGLGRQDCLHTKNANSNTDVLTTCVYLLQGKHVEVGTKVLRLGTWNIIFIFSQHLWKNGTQTLWQN
jgi:hypothetical protein